MNPEDERNINMPEMVKPSSRIHHLTSRFPYFYLSMPVMLGMIISLAGYDLHIKATLFKSLTISNSTEKLGWDLMNSCVPLGGFVGTFLISFLSSMGNEKVILLSIQLVGLAGSAFYFGAYLGSSNTCFTLSRFLHGFFAGGAMSFGIVTMFNLVPRGRHRIVSSTIQPLINLGILLSGFASLDYITKGIWIVTIFPLVVTQLIQTVIVVILPESPISIFKRTRDSEKTVHALRMIRDPKWNNYGELELIREDAFNDESKTHVSMFEFLKVKDIRVPLLITILVMVFQQFSGINVVVMQASEFLKVFQFPNPDVAVVIMLSVGFVAATISAMVVSRVGTKFYSVLGYAIMSIGFIAAYVSDHYKYNKVGLGAICVVLIGFNTGPGSLPWVIFKDTFEPKYQQAAQGILTSFSWVANLLIVSSFSAITRAINVSSMLIFGILCFIFAVILQLFMCETRNRSYNQIIEDYQTFFWHRLIKSRSD